MDIIGDNSSPFREIIALMYALDSINACDKDPSYPSWMVDIAREAIMMLRLAPTIQYSELDNISYFDIQVRLLCLDEQAKASEIARKREFVA